jgi:hypothetical protein
MKREIRRLTPADALQYRDLLSKSFGSSKGFMVQNRGSEWVYADDYYITLGVFHDGRLVSSMRTEWILTEKEFRYKMMTDVQFPFDVTFPSVYLTKAGTLPGIKAQGLNSILRYLSIKVAQSWNARYIFGSMVEGSPRIFTMQEMGYEFISAQRQWRGNFISEKPPLVAWLDLSTQGDRALSYLEDKLSGILADYVVNFDFVNCRIDEKPKEKFPWVA